MLVAEIVAGPERLREALPGLAGIVGFLVLPTLGAWLKLMLQLMDWDRSGLSRPRRLSGFTLVEAPFLTLALGFFTILMLKAAGELRAVQIEAPVVVAVLQGGLVGLAIWAAYTAGLSILRKDARRRRMERRFGGFLR